MFNKRKLDSGLRVVVAPVEKMRSVTTLVLVENGSRYEKKKENGISHFLEHMFFKGTENRPSEEELFGDFDKTGGEYNGLTHKEWTGYYVRLRPKHFETGLEWLSDILLRSLLKKEDIENEKGVILEERNMYLDTPAQFIGEVWENLLYGDQPLGRMIIGEEENIRRFERSDFTGYLERHYDAANTLVCVAGRAEGAVPLVEKYFGEMREKKAEGSRKVDERQEAPATLIRGKETAQNHLCVGVRGYDMFSDKRYAQAVLAKILGGMASSRLFLLIRGRGLAYYISTSSQTYTDTGYLVTRAGIDAGRTEQGVGLILDQYKRLAQQGAEKEEVEKAKENIKGNLALKLESSNYLASFVGKQELFKKEIMTPRQVFEKIDGVDAAQVRDLARELFVPQNLNLAMIGSEDQKKDLKRIINNF